MNWRSVCIVFGTVCAAGGAVWLLLGLSATVGWVLAVLGALELLVGLAPEQMITIFKIPELRKKIFITLIFLAVYRIGYYVPLPMVDQAKMAERMSQAQGGALGQVIGFVSLFSGGNLSSACIFALAITPYISSSIIIQL